MDLIDIIKQRREELGLSQAALSERMEQRGQPLPRATLNNWEQGRRRFEYEWSPDFLAAIADSLEMPFLELLGMLGFPVAEDFSPDVVDRLIRIEAVTDPDRRTRLLKAIDALIEATK